MREISREEIDDNEFTLMELCWELALSSNCKEAQYGAVVVNDYLIAGEDNLIIGEGYNHTIEELVCDKCPRRVLDVKSGVANDLCYALHAERCAIDDTKLRKDISSLKDSKIYIGKRKNGEIKSMRGKPYCTACATDIYVNGFKEVIFYSQNGGFLVFDSKEFLIRSFRNLIDAYEEQLRL